MFRRPKPPVPPMENPQIQEMLADMPFREPVIDTYDPDVYAQRIGEPYNEHIARIDAHEAPFKEANARADRQWVAVTGASQRAILSDETARQAAARFTTVPLSESLPNTFVETMKARDPRLVRLAGYTGRTLGKLLALPPVPDQALKPDVSNAPGLYRPIDAAEEIDSILKYVQSEAAVQRKLGWIQQRVTQRPGVTPEEKTLVARRYRYARDVKLIGLAAELQDQPLPENPIAKEGLVAHELESGVRLVATEEALATAPNLLDPTAWEKRYKLKDRVHVVTIDGKDYIMKEKKTPYHTDHPEDGHINGLTSEQEFATAKMFGDLGELHEGHVRMHWEKPLGYVDFPDGYQFTMFEAEPYLIAHNAKGFEYQLAKAIEAHPESFVEEFETVRQRAKELYWQQPHLAFRNRDPAPDWQPIAGQDELTFKEFAELKAFDMRRQATDFRDDTLYRQGYVDNDTDGYGFRLHLGDNPSLEIVNFDFEQYATDLEYTARMLDKEPAWRQDGEHTYTSVDTDQSDIMHVADFAVQEQRGYAYPKTARHQGL